MAPNPVTDTTEALHLVLDPEMRRAYELLERVAPTPLPVLVLGETGSGKDVAAAWLHHRSGGAPKPFLKINCASLAESLIESELFGHEKGAFTGAHGPRRGLFEAADGGTLFLDEVGELSLRVQAKLLRALDCGEIVRVGSTEARRVDVRFVSATHRSLERMVEEGQFREDLFFRISGLTIRIPPLRDRKNEIVPLAQHFLDRTAKRLDRRAPLLGESAASALLGHSWPGNIRELRHVIERAIVMCAGHVLEADHLALPRPAPKVVVDEIETEELPPHSSGIRGQIQTFERDRIVAALVKTGGNQTRAAELLHVSRRTLTNKLNTYAIERPRKRISGSIPIPTRAVSRSS